MNATDLSGARKRHKATCLTFLTIVISAIGFILGAAEPLTFKARLAEANRLLDEGKPAEALTEVKAASLLDTNRFEAPFLAAVIFLELKKPEPARLALDAALTLAPPAKKATVQELKQEIDDLVKSLSQPAAPQASSSKLSPTARRQLDILMLIIEEADKANLDLERKKLLNEFLTKSEPFVKENPDHLPVWVLRTIAALELNKRKEGWAAGKELKRLAVEKSEDPKLRKIIATLDRRGWWIDELPRVNYVTLSFAELRQLANDDDPKAQVALGKQLLSLPGRQEEAASWFRKAADAGDVAGQVSFACALLRGVGVSQEYERGLGVLQSYAEKGDPEAQAELGIGMIYGFWNNTAKVMSSTNHAAGLRLLTAAHEGGNKDAAAALGSAHDYLKDHTSATKWLRLRVNYNIPDDFHSQSCLVWLLATSANANLRNGAEALALAKKATAEIKTSTRMAEISRMTTNYYIHSFVATALAAAYAETGDFQMAIAAESEALGYLKATYPNAPEVAKYASKGNESRRKLYGKGRPYRSEKRFFQ